MRKRGNQRGHNADPSGAGGRRLSVGGVLMRGQEAVRLVAPVLIRRSRTVHDYRERRQGGLRHTPADRRGRDHSGSLLSHYLPYQ